MRTTLFATAAVFGLALAVPAMAQSTTAPASNIDPQDTHSTIAPALPTPPVPVNANARQFLRAADAELKQNRTGEAQEALERAETWLLTRSTPAGAAGIDRGPMVRRVTAARDALGHSDSARAEQIIEEALATPVGRRPAPVAQATPPAAGSGTGQAAVPAYNDQMQPAVGASPEYGVGDPLQDEGGMGTGQDGERH
jgi:hypothetical protein